MSAYSTSITTQNLFEQEDVTPTYRNRALPVMGAAIVALTLATVNPTPAVTRFNGLTEFSPETVSVSEYRDIERKINKTNYSWITSAGYGIDESTQTDMFY